MPNTPRLGLRYPAPSAGPNVPQDVQNLAEDVDALSLGWAQVLAQVSTSTDVTITTTGVYQTVQSCPFTMPANVPSSRRVVVVVENIASTSVVGNLYGSVGLTDSSTGNIAAASWVPFGSASSRVPAPNASLYGYTRLAIGASTAVSAGGHTFTYRYYQTAAGTAVSAYINMMVLLL